MMYIPLNGIFFRLVGRKSGLAIYSNDAKQPKVSHTEPHPKSKDQIFTLIYGTGDRAGLWFKIVEGTGACEGAFRMILPASGTEIYSSKRINTRFGNLEGYEDITDAFFEFSFETPIVKEVIWDLDPARIDDNVRTVTLFMASFTNNIEDPAESEFLFNATYKDKFLFAHQDGKFPPAHGVLFRSGLPIVSGGKVKLSSNKDMYPFDTESFNRTSIHKTIPIKVSPNKTATVEVQAKKCIVKVPFTMKLVSPTTNTEMETIRGLWMGELHWSLTYPVDVA
ncbi:hypothetical protein C8Q77DRAFT_1073061 [Trametes polyzona]|nr:hypothetical protein C8Q77DRAFT_1073061 [Trametes polyzona]